MTEIILTKRCSHCKQIKPILDFPRNRTTKDDYRDQCKVCHNIDNKKYRQTEKGKAYHETYRQSEKGKKYHCEYSRKYRKTEKDKQSRKKYCKYNPEKRQAKNAVAYAVRSGKLPPAKTLQCFCGNQAKHYHHHKGYATEHWLDVIPVCVKCHRNLP